MRVLNVSKGNKIRSTPVPADAPDNNETKNALSIISNFCYLIDKK